MAEVLESYRDAPVGFVKEVLGDMPYAKQREMLDKLVDNRRVSVVGANGSGKDWAAARAVLWWLATRLRAVVVVTGPTRRQVEEIVWRELRAAYKASRVPLGGRVSGSHWNIDDDRFAIGFSTNKPDNLQGFHSPELLVVVTEAHAVPQDQMEALKRLLPARMLLTGNAFSRDGEFFDSHHTKRHLYACVTISAFDTPNFTGENGGIPGTPTEEDVEERKLDWGEDHPLYQGSVLGRFPDMLDDSLIARSAIEQAVARWEQYHGVEGQGGCPVVPAEADGGGSVVPAEAGTSPFACHSERSAAPATCHSERSAAPATCHSERSGAEPRNLSGDASLGGTPPERCFDSACGCAQHDKVVGCCHSECSEESLRWAHRSHRTLPERCFDSACGCAQHDKVVGCCHSECSEESLRWAHRSHRTLPERCFDSACGCAQHDKVGACGCAQHDKMGGGGCAQHDKTEGAQHDKTPDAPRRLGVDVARFGSDKTALCVRRGWLVESLRSFARIDTMRTAGEASVLVREQDIPAVFVDEGGLGGGVVDRLRELGAPVHGVQFGGKARQSGRFANMRAELFWELRRLFNDQLIAIPPDEELISQLLGLRYDVTSAGQVRMESKSALRRRGQRSPDKADALALAFMEPPSLQIWTGYEPGIAPVQEEERERAHSRPVRDSTDPASEGGALPSPNYGVW